MARKKLTPRKLARIETTTRIFQGTNRLLWIASAVAFGLLITATSFPQKREYQKLQLKLKQTMEREEEILARKEHKKIELHALREDTAFLEVHARDRLNYYRPGERVLRFDRD